MCIRITLAEEVRPHVTIPSDFVVGVGSQPLFHVLLRWVSDAQQDKVGHYDLLIPQETVFCMSPVHNNSWLAIGGLRQTTHIHNQALVQVAQFLLLS